MVALIIRKKDHPKKIGANFITKNTDPFQLGFINYPTNHKIKPHFHKNRKRIINTCTEVLIVKEGILDFSDLASVTLEIETSWA